jgi:hypothetical protein
MGVLFGQRASDLFNRYTMNYNACLDGDLIVVHDDVQLAADALATVTFVAFLRTCVTQGVRVRWKGRAHGPLDSAPLHHLWPPESMRGVPRHQERAWRESFRYGLCYFRQGPEFLLVKDARDAMQPVRMVIDHPDLVATFLSGTTPLRHGALSAAQREAVDVLTAENLVYRVDDLLLTLPTRMHRWPIPFSAV